MLVPYALATSLMVIATANTIYLDSSFQASRAGTRARPPRRWPRSSGRPSGGSSSTSASWAWRSARSRCTCCAPASSASSCSGSEVGSWRYRLMTLLPAPAVLAPLVWGKMAVWLAVPTNVVCGLFLPAAYVGFILLQRSQRLPGRATSPAERRGGLWLTAMTVATLVLTGSLLWFVVTQGPGYLERIGLVDGPWRAVTLELARRATSWSSTTASWAPRAPARAPGPDRAGAPGLRRRPRRDEAELPRVGPQRRRARHARGDRQPRRLGGHAGPARAPRPPGPGHRRGHGHRPALRGRLAGGRAADRAPGPAGAPQRLPRRRRHGPPEEHRRWLGPGRRRRVPGALHRPPGRLADRAAHALAVRAARARGRLRGDLRRHLRPARGAAVRALAGRDVPARAARLLPRRQLPAGPGAGSGQGARSEALAAGHAARAGPAARARRARPDRADRRRPALRAAGAGRGSRRRRAGAPAAALDGDRRSPRGAGRLQPRAAGRAGRGGRAGGPGPAAAGPRPGTARPAPARALRGARPQAVRAAHAPLQGRAGVPVLAQRPAVQRAAAQPLRPRPGVPGT